MKKKYKYKLEKIRFEFLILDNEDHDDYPYYIDFIPEKGSYSVQAETFDGDIDPFDDSVETPTYELAKIYFSSFIERQDYFE